MILHRDTSARNTGKQMPCSRRRGLSLAEVVVSTLLVGILLTAALVSVGAAARTMGSAGEASNATCLARQLLEEITRLPYDDPNQSPVFGRESGEIAAVGDRSLCDDIDDLVDWDDTPPHDHHGDEISGYTGWIRSADVVKLSAAGNYELPNSSNDQGLRLVTVTVMPSSGRSYTLRALRSKDGGCLQAQGVDQTIVSWVGVTLQSGDGGPISGGVGLINHASDQ